MFILAEDGLRDDAKYGAAGRFEQRLDIATILVIVDPGKFLPNCAIGDFLNRAFEYYRLVAFFRGNGAVTVARQIFRFARARSGAEPESVLPPDTPDDHEMRPAIRPRGRDPVIVRFFETLERPRSGFETGRRVVGLLQCIWPVWMTRFWFKHGAPCRNTGMDTF